MLPSLTDAIRLPLQVLIRSPGRSALTMLGLAIGVAAFIAMVSFGSGARRSVLAQFEALGVNILRVRTRVDVPQLGVHVPRPLTDEDVASLRREAPSLATVVPVAWLDTELKHGNRRTVSRVHGTTPEFTAVHDWAAVRGGTLRDDDLTGRRKVCVLGATPARALFGRDDPLGQRVTIATTFRCHVVGVLAEKGTAASGADLDDLVLVPVDSFRTYLNGADRYEVIYVRPRDAASRGRARRETTDVLLRAHGIEAAEAADFDVRSPDDTTRVADEIARILTGLLIGIAAVSLMVGGIGIMNIQLVSVAERTHEIGIRLAVGASPRQIRGQFLLEALILSLVGAAGGVALGLAVEALVSVLMGWERTVSVVAALVGSSFGVAVGLVFGYLPADRASRLDPIDALRRM